ncbi:hypothetical protein RhiirA4_456651 [Rhizophagus irregularis]|uniref:Uncharacterized protein n=1 Tax=Rhizophagus irregularis TaxID=588596 RepID=A0A2I1G854_9GLOM|nr:hypothetical protein RhiirA4_456651 [Rhizophagus irregularis]
MKFILMLIIVIVAFSAFASANEPRITPVEKSSSLVARAGTCPSGTYACADKEGGCCSDGTSCLPNFQCSGSGKSSGATSTTKSEIVEAEVYVLIMEPVFNDESDETEDSKTNEKLNINNSEFDINEIIDNTSFKF